MMDGNDDDGVEVIERVTFDNSCSFKKNILVSR